MEYKQVWLITRNINWYDFGEKYETIRHKTIENTEQVISREKESVTK